CCHMRWCPVIDAFQVHRSTGLKEQLKHVEPIWSAGIDGGMKRRISLFVPKVEVDTLLQHPRYRRRIATINGIDYPTPPDNAINTCRKRRVANRLSLEFVHRTAP